MGISGLIACMQLPRNVSPVSASFFGLQRQGIHPVLCVACSHPLGGAAHRLHGVGLTSWCLRCSSASVLHTCSRQNRSYPFRLFKYTWVTPTPEEWKVAPAPGRANACRSCPVDLGWRSSCEGLSVPRKEVIQPHLPVRLPCYDFTPITDPTLDACLPVGLAQRLQVLPTFVV